MKRGKKIFYWSTTIFLAFAMIASGVQQLFHVGGFTKILADLGYPPYLQTILGFWKIAGVIAILIPGFLLVKEWAYAGFFFVMSGALYSHLASAEPISAAMPAIVLCVVTVLSWYLRPAERRIQPFNK